MGNNPKSTGSKHLQGTKKVNSSTIDSLSNTSTTIADNVKDLDENKHGEGKVNPEDEQKTSD